MEEEEESETDESSQQTDSNNEEEKEEEDSDESEEEESDEDDLNDTRVWELKAKLKAELGEAAVSSDEVSFYCRHLRMNENNNGFCTKRTCTSTIDVKHCS